MEMITSKFFSSSSSNTFFKLLSFSLADHKLRAMAIMV
jgi:hypothetical protein